MISLKKYRVFFSVYWQSLLTYRFDTTIYALTSLVTPLLGLFIWLTIQESTPTLAYNQSEIVFYFLAAAICGSITTAWGAYFIYDDIKKGTILGYLTRPFSILENFATNNIVEKIFKVSIIGIALSITWMFFAYSKGIQLPLKLEFLPLVILALGLALTMMILIDVSMGLTAFWLDDVDFVTGTFFTADALLSGRIVPITFLPDYLKSFSHYLPFRYLVSFPIEIALGKLSNSDLIQGFIILICWTIAFWYIQKLLYKEGTKKFGGYGG